MFFFSFIKFFLKFFAGEKEKIFAFARRNFRSRKPNSVVCFGLLVVFWWSFGGLLVVSISLSKKAKLVKKKRLGGSHILNFLARKFDSENI
mgnify:CR=1 FL=1